MPQGWQQLCVKPVRQMKLEPRRVSATPTGFPCLNCSSPRRLGHPLANPRRLFIGNDFQKNQASDLEIRSCHEVPERQRFALVVAHQQGREPLRLRGGLELNNFTPLDCLVIVVAGEQLADTSNHMSMIWCRSEESVRMMSIAAGYWRRVALNCRSRRRRSQHFQCPVEFRGIRVYESAFQTYRQ